MCPCKCWMPSNGEQCRYSYALGFPYSQWLSWGHCCQDLQPQALHHFLASHAHTGLHRKRAEAAGPAGSGTHCPIAACSTGTGSWPQAGKGEQPRSKRNNVPIKGCGIVQAVAVLEDTARGPSACLEFASSCYIPINVQKKARRKFQEQCFSCSSLFLLFLCGFPHRVRCALRLPRVSEQVGWCWTQGPQSGEASAAERRGRSGRAEAQREEVGWDRHFLLCCIKRCFCTESSLHSSSIFHPVHHGPFLSNSHPTFPWQWHAGADALALVLSWRAAYPPALCPEELGPALMWLTSSAVWDCCFLQWQAHIYSISHCRALWSWKIYKCYNHFYYHLYTTFNVITMWLTHKIHF